MKYNRILTLFAFAFVGALLALAQPRISSNKETHSFGQIEWKHPAIVEYTITNTGDKPLVLTNVTTSCACSVASWTKNPILPGEKGSVTATFDAKALGHFNKTIGIYSNAQPQLVYLKFTGEVVTEITDFSHTHPYQIGDLLTNLTEITFPEVHRGEQPTIQFSVVNLSDRPYAPVLMHLPPYLKMKERPEVLLKGKRGVIELVVDTEQLFDLGLTQASVYLARFAGDKVNEENKIPVSILLLPDFTSMSEQALLNAPTIHLSETSIDVAARLAKKRKVSHDIIISNTGRSPLKINKIQVFNSAVGVHLKKNLLQPGETAKLQITIHKKEADNQQNQLRVLMITNDPVHPKIEINLKR